MAERIVTRKAHQFVASCKATGPDQQQQINMENSQLTDLLAEGARNEP
jgi:hypothetical protein